MQQIIFCKGLPASGKSVWSRQYCLDHPEFIRINKDDIRILLGSPTFSRKFEASVLDIERRMGIAILESGKSLIVDDTNLAPKHQKYWDLIASDRQIELTCQTFDTSLEECIRRDNERSQRVGIGVIMNMYETYIQSKN